MKNEKFSLKRVLYILSIVIVFVSLVQLSINTFIDSDLTYPELTCAKPIRVDSTDTTVEDQACKDKYEADLKVYGDKLKNENLYKFITSLAISLIVLILIAYSSFNVAINQGFYAGITFNLLVSMVYVEKSYIAVGLLFAILVGLIYYINKDQK